MQAAGAFSVAFLQTSFSDCYPLCILGTKLQDAATDSDRPETYFCRLRRRDKARRTLHSAPNYFPRFSEEDFNG
jgi:hypothetical protein